MRHTLTARDMALDGADGKVLATMVQIDFLFGTLPQVDDFDHGRRRGGGSGDTTARGQRVVSIFHRPGKG